MAYPLITEKQTFFYQHANGNWVPASGYKLFVYFAGTTTKATIHKETDESSQHSNPIQLNQRGEVDNGLYVAGGAQYKLVLAPSTDTDPPSAAVWTRDKLTPINDTTVTVSEWQASGYTPTYVGATSFTVTGDRTSTFQIGMRIKATVTAGTIYGTITNSVYTSLTTVTVANDSGSLDAGLSAVELGILTANNSGMSVPADTIPIRRGSSTATKFVRIEADGITAATTRVWSAQDRNVTVADIMDSHGRCQLAKVSANLVLSPYNGNTIVINSTLCVIPDAGVTLAPTALSINTTYYIYAYLSGSTLTLEASATAYASQAGTGIAIKSGDATRTLVGMARTITGPAWVDTAAQRFVRSWFNDSGVVSLNFLTGNVLCSGTLVELNSSARAEFLVWANEPFQALVSGYAQQVAGAGEAFMNIGIDGATAQEGRGGGSNYTLSAFVNCSTSFVSGGIAEGYHYATMLGTIGSNNANFIGSGTAGARCAISVMTN